MRLRKKGVITFEWMILIALLVLGIVGGLAVLRDSIITECAEVADAILSHNKSYVIREPLGLEISYETKQEIKLPNGSVITSDENVSFESGKAGGSEYYDHDAFANPSHISVEAPGTVNGE